MNTQILKESSSANDAPIVISFSGDKEDYVRTIKALVHLLSNQDEPNSMHNLMCSDLIDDMLNQLLC